MPRETLQRLEGDVARLLLAGSSVAREDPALKAHAQALAACSVHIPAFAVLGAHLARVVSASPRESARALLTLAVQLAQVRGALVVPDRVDPEAGELTPVAPWEALGTPLGAEEVEALHRALTGTGEGRRELVERASREGRVRDLRLVDDWLSALGDPYVGSAVVPAVAQLGRAASGLLLGALELRGNETDARRLTSLARIEGGALRPLLERALTEGSVPVRAAAMASLADVAPEVAWGLAPAVARGDRAEAVRAAALEVLGRASGDEALEVLLGALSEPKEEAARAAVSALSRCGHPDATARLLERLPEGLTAPERKPPRRARPAPEGERAQRPDEGEGEPRVALRVLAALGGRADPEARARLLAVLRSDAPPALRVAAGEALRGGGAPEALEALAELLGDGEPGVHALALEALGAMAPAACWERSQRALTPEARGGDGAALAGELLALAAHRAGELDPRWSELALGLLDDEALRCHAIDVLVKLGERRVCERLLGWLADGGVDAATAVDALGRLGDRRATPALTALAGAADAGLRYYALDALRKLDDPSAAPALREEIARAETDRARAKALQDLVNYLERERTTSASGGALG